MTYGTILVILGPLIALSPFSGLPSSWLSIIVPIVGLLIVLIGYRQQRERRLNGAASASFS